MVEILLIGSSGHARAVFDVVRAQNNYRLAGLIDSFLEPGTIRFGCVVLGGEKDIRDICRQRNLRHLFVAIGDNYQRQAMTGRIQAVLPEVEFVTLVHPSAIVGSDVRIGRGSVLMPGAIVVAGCQIGEGCLLNTASSLDHESEMGCWSSIAPGAVVGGRVRLGERTSVGLGANVIQAVSIGSDTVLGAGAVVVDDIPGSVVAHGNPCRVIRKRCPDEAYL